jgi:hypothetical protein
MTYFMTYEMKQLIVFLIAIIVHEAGHVIAAWIYLNYPPKVKLYWWGITVSEKKDLWNLDVLEFIIVLMFGIFTGLCFILFSGYMNTQLLVLYLIASGIDIYQLIWLMPGAFKKNMSKRYHKPMAEFILYTNRKQNWELQNAKGTK